jgi:hypothetical protein
MPDRKPNYFARVLAVLALIVAFMLVVFTLVTSGGSDGDGGDDDDVVTNESKTTAKGERAVEAGVWILREGETLTSISEETGIDIGEIEDLNPDVDAQTLSPGQRIALVEGGADKQPANEREDTSPGPDGSGVGDEGPTGSGDALDDDGSTSSN